MAKADKPHYAPVPARVMGNQNLSALDHRVLQAIGAHDRLGANGIGCYASRDRLAKLVEAHANSVSRSISTLVEQGLIEVKQHPLNGRLRVYKVVYTQFDATYLGVKIGNEAATGIGNRAATDKGRKGNQSATDFGTIGNHEPPASVTVSVKVHEQDQRDSDVNIFSETGLHSTEVVNTSRETAQRAGTNAGVSAMLSMIERGIQAGTARNSGVWRRFLEDQIASLDDKDPEHARSKRLLDALGQAQ